MTKGPQTGLRHVHQSPPKGGQKNSSNSSGNQHHPHGSAKKNNAVHAPAESNSGRQGPTGNHRSFAEPENVRERDEKTLLKDDDKIRSKHIHPKGQTKDTDQDYGAVYYEMDANEKANFEKLQRVSGAGEEFQTNNPNATNVIERQHGQTDKVSKTEEGRGGVFTGKIDKHTKKEEVYKESIWEEKHSGSKTAKKNEAAHGFKHKGDEARAVDVSAQAGKHPRAAVA